MPKEWLDTIKALKKKGNVDNPYALATWLYKKKHGHAPQKDESVKEMWNGLTPKYRDDLLNATESYIAPTSRESLVYKNWDDLPNEVREQVVTEFSKDYESFIKELNSIKEFSNISSCPSCGNLEVPETSPKPTIIQNPVPEIQAKGTYSTIHDGPGTPQILQEGGQNNPKTVAILIQAGVDKHIDEYKIVETLMREGVSSETIDQAIELLKKSNNVEASSPVLAPYEDPATVATLIENQLHSGKPAEEVVNNLFLSGVTEGTMNRAIKMLKEKTTEISPDGEDLTKYLNEKIDDQCHICEVKYNTRRDLAKHILEMHGLTGANESSVKCPNCGSSNVDDFDSIDLSAGKVCNDCHKRFGKTDEDVSGPPAGTTMAVMDSEPTVLPTKEVDYDLTKNMPTDKDVYKPEEVGYIESKTPRKCSTCEYFKAPNICNLPLSIKVEPELGCCNKWESKTKDEKTEFGDEK